MNGLAMMHLLDKSINRLANRLERLERSLEFSPRDGDKNHNAGGYNLVAIGATATVFSLVSTGRVYVRSLSMPRTVAAEVYLTIHYNGSQTQFKCCSSMIVMPINCAFDPGLIEVKIDNSFTGTSFVGAWMIEAFERFPEMEKPDDD